MYCIAPFSSLVVNGDGTQYPCCTIERYRNDAVDPSKSIKENFLTANKELRTLFLSDLPFEEKYKYCKSCTQVKPPAQNLLHNAAADKNIDYVKEPTLTSLHLRASNFCNLACRMCNSSSSNLIAKERGELGNGNKKYEYSTINENTTSFVSSIIDQIPKLKMLWLSGGEPLINPENWQILQAAYDTGHSKDITLHINTNGTFMLSDKQINIFNSFKNVELHVSLDGVDEVGEYIRTNLKIDKWIENVKRYKEKLSSDTTDIGLVYSVSVFNITRIIDILKLAEMLNISPVCNYVHYPQVLSIRNMNDKSKEYVNKLYSDINLGSEINKIVHYMNLPREVDSIEVANSIDRLDNNVIEKGLYNNYKPFREVDTFWYNMLKGS